MEVRFKDTGMKFKVSIIIPVYNVEKYIADCFASIVQQTYSGAIECLFIDDCGTDRSMSVLDELVKSYDGPIDMRIVHHDKNRGLSAARNTGLSDSTGEYIFFLDSDDQLYPQSIKNLANAVEKESRPDIVLGSYKVNIPEHSINKYRYKYEVFSEQPVIAKAFLNDHFFCMAHNKLVRRGFIVNNGLFFKEGILHEDNLWSFQCFHMATRVVTIPDISYLYLIRKDSIMTSSKCEKRLESSCIIYDEVLKDIRNGRYHLVGQDSLNYLKDILNTRCIRLFEQIYSKDFPRSERLKRLKSMPQSIRRIVVKYWFPPTRFLMILKFCYQHGCYHIFDSLLMLSKKKNRIHD